MDGSSSIIKIGYQYSNNISDNSRTNEDVLKSRNDTNEDYTYRLMFFNDNGRDKQIMFMNHSDSYKPKLYEGMRLVSGTNKYINNFVKLHEPLSIKNRIPGNYKSWY